MVCYMHIVCIDLRHISAGFFCARDTHAQSLARGTVPLKQGDKRRAATATASERLQRKVTIGWAKGGIVCVCAYACARPRRSVVYFVFSGVREEIAFFFTSHPWQKDEKKTRDRLLGENGMIYRNLSNFASFFFFYIRTFVLDRKPHPSRADRNVNSEGDLSFFVGPFHGQESYGFGPRWASRRRWPKATHAGAPPGGPAEDVCSNYWFNGGVCDTDRPGVRRTTVAALFTDGERNWRAPTMDSVTASR